MIELKNIHKYYNPGSVNELCLFQDATAPAKLPC